MLHDYSSRLTHFRLCFFTAFKSKASHAIMRFMQKRITFPLLVLLSLSVGCAPDAHNKMKQNQCATQASIENNSSRIRTYALRLQPGEDLKKELQKFTNKNHIRAGAIVTCVGSLRQASLRLANQKETSVFEDKFEIISLVGTLSSDGSHLHAGLSDGTGKTIGGHVMDGCLIYMTAEIIVAKLPDLEFSRTTDAVTGFQELQIHTNPSTAH